MFKAKDKKVSFLVKMHINFCLSQHYLDEKKIACKLLNVEVKIEFLQVLLKLALHEFIFLDKQNKC